MKKIAFALLGLVMLAGTAMGAGVETQTVKTELWSHVANVDGAEVACFWVQNRKGMADNVSTGLACVQIKERVVEIVVEVEVPVPGDCINDGVF